MSLNFWDNWYGRRFFNLHPEYYIWYARPGYAQPDRDCYLWQYACDNGGADEPLDKNILLGEYIEAKAPCEECERLKKQIAELEKTNAELEQENARLKENVAGRDSVIRELDSRLEQCEKLNTEQHIEMTQAKADAEKLHVENGVLKETIVSLQKKVEAVTKENEQLKRAAEKPVEREGLLKRILKILFGGA